MFRLKTSFLIPKQKSLPLIEYFILYRRINFVTFGTWNSSVATLWRSYIELRKSFL